MERECASSTYKEISRSLPHLSSILNIGDNSRLCSVLSLTILTGLVPCFWALLVDFVHSVWPLNSELNPFDCAEKKHMMKDDLDCLVGVGLCASQRVSVYFCNRKQGGISAKTKGALFPLVLINKRH